MRHETGEPPQSEHPGEHHQGPGEYHQQEQRGCPFLDGIVARNDPAANAEAVVVVITISRVLLEESPPATGPAKLAYNPNTGLTPASTAEAIPSGTLPIAPGRPATHPLKARPGQDAPSATMP